MGSAGRHMSIRVDDPAAGNGRRSIRLVWWRAPDEAATLAAGMTLDVAIEPKLNTWNGRTTVEAELRDVHICEV